MRILMIVFNPPKEDLNLTKDISLLESEYIVKYPYQFNIMMLLFKFGRLRFKNICKELKITPGNLDHHSKMLVKKGWVKERFALDIRPMKTLEITQKGKDEFHQYALELKRVLHSLKFD